MRTRTRTESTNGDVLDFSWDDIAEEPATPITQQTDSTSQDAPLAESPVPEDTPAQETPEPEEIPVADNLPNAEETPVPSDAPAEPPNTDVAPTIDDEPTPTAAPLKTTTFSPASNRQLDITQEPQTLSELLALLQSQAGYSNHELYARFHINQTFYTHLQKSQYAQILDNTMGIHDLEQNVVYILKKLKADDTQMENGRRMLAQELKRADLQYTDDNVSSPSVLINNYDTLTTDSKRSKILTFLPKIIIITVIVILLATIIFSQILPRLGGRAIAPKMNFAPLLNPVQPAPKKLPIPK